MPLSNAERQKRWVDRLKSRAVGVTPNMIHRAARLEYERWAVDEDEPPSWPQFLAKKPAHWAGFIPDQVHADYSEFGADAEVMRAVAQVMHAITNPPKG